MVAAGSRELACEPQLWKDGLNWYFATGRRRIEIVDSPVIRIIDRLKPGRRTKRFAGKIPRD